ncbi:MAG: hypothetical protein KKA19_00040, partial [Candidatus Margulisbacteria bacterium]|nr:hypothetical protein [Candidatus Margulisiibacteriota bacterium]
LVLGREISYIGTLIDDLVTKEIKEPYRMMTSRSEYRLLLRQDNADRRLTDIGYRVGLISEDRYRQFRKKIQLINEESKRLKSIKITPNTGNIKLLSNIDEPIRTTVSLADLLARPKVTYEKLEMLDNQRKKLPQDVIEQVEIELKYEGYIRRQGRQIEEFKKLENKKIDKDLDFYKVKGLRKEAQSKLSQIQPMSLGQASRIAGVNPADISVLIIYLEAMRRGGNGHKSRNEGRDKPRHKGLNKQNVSRETIHRRPKSKRKISVKE